VVGISREQYSVLQVVLKPEAFKKLQTEQTSWIANKDKVATEAKKNSDTEIGKELAYYSMSGKETYLRVNELNNIYLQGL
jgi:uncharacterized protein YecT (DUF1311 family)